MDNTTVTLILSHVCSSVRLKIEQTLSLTQESLITAFVNLSLAGREMCEQSIFCDAFTNQKNALFFPMLLLQMHSP